MTSAWTPVGPARNVEHVSTGTTPESTQATVMVSQVVLDKMRRELPPAQASAAARAIRAIPDPASIPIHLDVPSDPPGTRYWAVAPADNRVPAMVYRRTIGEEPGDYLVVSLLDQSALSVLQESGESPVVRGVAASVAAGGTISASAERSRVGSPVFASGEVAASEGQDTAASG